MRLFQLSVSVRISIMPITAVSGVWDLIKCIALKRGNRVSTGPASGAYPDNQDSPAALNWDLVNCKKWRNVIFFFPDKAFFSVSAQVHRASSSGQREVSQSSSTRPGQEGSPWAICSEPPPITLPGGLLALQKDPCGGVNVSSYPRCSRLGSQAGNKQEGPQGDVIRHDFSKRRSVGDVVGLVSAETHISKVMEKVL